MPFGKGIKLIIYDLHTLHNRFYFHNNCSIKMASGIPLLREELSKHKEKNYNIAFPDEGAYKRFGKFFPEFPNPVICGKTRVDDDPNARIVKITDGEVTGKHCVIVDDLVRSGGTLIECRVGLMKGGASAVSAYCTHAIFPQQSWKKFTETKEPLFDTFWITNTNPLVSSILSGKKPFTVLDISENFASLL